jgi:iron complex outermembrane receptor protein
MQARIWRITATFGVLWGLAAALPAHAQENAGEGTEPVAAAEDRIVVTGTLLRGLRDEGLAPVDVLGIEDISRQGTPAMLDLARRLPVSAGVLGDSSQFDPRSQFTEGLASINLRGLGPQRTLVLLNGRRLAASGAGNLPVVDLNLLPAGALERIDILKDGAAATYGSDAIAGVVNLVTRTRQEGFLAGADYRWIEGSDGDWTAALSWGAELGPTRLLLSAGWQHRSELRPADRAYTLRPFAENPQGGWSGGGNPGNFDFDGSRGGTAFVADQGCEALGGFRTAPGSSSDLCYGNFLGFSNLVEPEDRFQLFADVERALGPRATLRLTALFARADTKLFTSPSFLPTIPPSAQAAFGGTGLFTIPAYAPALADYCARFGPDAGCAVDAAGMPEAPALAYPVRFRPFLAGGNPLFDNPRGTAALDRYSESLQFTAELRHELGPRLELTAGLAWSQYFRWFEVGDVFVDLLQNALAGFGGPDCAYASPAARTALTQAQLAAVAGTGGCTFFNPFSTGVAGNRVTGEANPFYAGAGSPLGLDLAPGAGLVNDAATAGDFYNVWERTARTRQLAGDLVLAGESGVRLPGGPIGFALGAQYRRDSYARGYQGGNDLGAYPCPGSVLDPSATCNPQPGALGFIGAGRDVDVSSDVWALFAELRLPVSRSITAQLSARYEDHGAGRGATFDPQMRVRVEAADWLALRAGVGSTFRAAPPQNTAADLVALTFIGGAFRAVDVFANTDLTPETATTWNVGLVLERAGFNASLDWWRYDFSGAIESEPVSGIVSALFGASGTANCGVPAFAALQARFTFSGGLCGAANVQRLATFGFNSADITTSGVDAQASYDWAMQGARLQAGVRGSYLIEYRVADTVVEGVVVQPAFDSAGLLNYQTTAYPLPQVKGQAWLEAEAGDHVLRLQANHVGSYRDQRAELFTPQTATLAGAEVRTGERIGAYTTLDAVWRWSLGEETMMSLALFNLLDTAPPFARLDHSFDPFTADALGFTAKLGVSWAF